MTRVAIDLNTQMEIVRCMRVLVFSLAILAAAALAGVPAMAAALLSPEVMACDQTMPDDNGACRSVHSNALAGCATMASCGTLRMVAAPLMALPRLQVVNIGRSFDLNRAMLKSAFVAVDYPPPRV